MPTILPTLPLISKLGYGLPYISTATSMRIALDEFGEWLQVRHSLRHALALECCQVFVDGQRGFFRLSRCRLAAPQTICGAKSKRCLMNSSGCCASIPYLLSSAAGKSAR